jgi:hypothetical protein
MSDFDQNPKGFKMLLKCFENGFCDKRKGKDLENPPRPRFSPAVSRSPHERLLFVCV